MEKTKENFSLLLYGPVDKERIDEEIERNRYVVENISDEHRDYANRELDYLLQLKSDINYQNDNLPRGIEKIILQVMESYTFWHSVNEVESDFLLVSNNYIHNLINISITFMVLF